MGHRPALWAREVGSGSRGDSLHPSPSPRCSGFGGGRLRFPRLVLSPPPPVSAPTRGHERLLPADKGLCKPLPGADNPTLRLRNERLGPFSPSFLPPRGGGGRLPGRGGAGRPRCRCRDGVGAAGRRAAAGPLHAAPPRAAPRPAAPRPHRPRRPHRHRHGGKRRHRGGHGAGAGPLRGPRRAGGPQRPAGGGRRPPHPHGDGERGGAVHAAGPGQPALGASLRQRLPAPGAPPAPPHQQRGGERRGHDGGRLQPLLPGEPPGPFPAHPAAAGAAAELRAQPRGHRRLPRPLRRPPAPRHPGPPAPRTAIDLPGLLRQQAGQRAARPRAGHAPAGHPGDVLRRAPRVRQHGALPPHAALAEAALPAAGLALLPRRSRGRPDLPALRHAGRPRVLQRPLLRRLPPAGAVAAGPRRPAGPGALGGQREAGGAGGDRGEPLASPHRFWTIKVTVTEGRRPPSAPKRPRVGMGAKWSSPRQSAARAGAALDLGGSGHVCAADLASCSSTAGSLGLRCPPRNGRACLPSPAHTRAQAMQCAPPYPCSKAAALPCKGTRTLQRSTPCLARACTRCSTHAPRLAHAAVQKPRLACACTQPPVPQRARPACTHLALHGHAHAAVCTPCLARPSHAHAAVCTPCLAGPCTRCSVHTLPRMPMHTLQCARPALHAHAHAAVCTPCLARPSHAHAAVCTPCLARPSHAHAAVCTPCLARPCTRCSTHALPCTPMHARQCARARPMLPRARARRHAAPNMAAAALSQPRPRGAARPRSDLPNMAAPAGRARHARRRRRGGAGRGLVGAGGGGSGGGGGRGAGGGGGTMGNCHTVGPNEALVVSGGCCGSDVKQYVYGGWAWAWWCITDTQRISLEIMTLQPRCEDVETAEGVALTVTGVAQVKIMTEKELLAVACEQFLGKNVQDVKNVVLQTLEGHLRSILGTLTVEQIYQDRDQFAKLVREVAAPDVGRMGIEILSFTIKDVYDKVDYLSSLGKTQTAAVRRDADIGVAEAERDAGIREAECKKEMLDVKFMADTKIADSRRAFELQKAAFTEEVNIKTAEAQLAYELQSAREQQKIRQEEIEIEVVQRKKQIDVEEKEIIRMEKELIATVKRPAEAEAYRIQQIAEGEKVKQVLIAQAEAEKIRKIGEAEAFVIEAIGMAEAERMKLKAEALQQYGEPAQLALVLDALPEIAAKVAAPLSKVDEIVILSGESGNTMSEVNRLLAEVPASVRAITGVDLTKIPLIQKATGAQA